MFFSSLPFRLAEQAGIKDFKYLSKGQLFNQLQRHCNYDRLLRTDIRRRIRNGGEVDSMGKLLGGKRKGSSSIADSVDPSSSSSLCVPNAKRPRVRLNTIDPIMMVPIEKKKKPFKFLRPNGTIVQFNVESLVDYIISSGEFSDPETRLPFSAENLKEIDELAKENGLSKPSVLEAKSNTHAYSEAKFRRDALLALERCAGEVITDILEIIENNDPDDAQIQLVVREFPAFLDYFRQMRDAEPEYASKCLAHWRLYILGPPNRPNEDDYGLIKVVAHFLRSCDEGLI